VKQRIDDRGWGIEKKTNSVFGVFLAVIANVVNLFFVILEPDPDLSGYRHQGSSVFSQTSPFRSDFSQLSALSFRSAKPQRGFALLLTLVVVSVIGVVAFGVGRLTLTEFRQTVRFQDSQDALQTAEAGIEDGLVRFRFNRDTEVPSGQVVMGASVAVC